MPTLTLRACAPPRTRVRSRRSQTALSCAGTNGSRPPRSKTSGPSLSVATPALSITQPRHTRRMHHKSSSRDRRRRARARSGSCSGIHSALSAPISVPTPAPVARAASAACHRPTVCCISVPRRARAIWAKVGRRSRGRSRSRQPSSMPPSLVPANLGQPLATILLSPKRAPRPTRARTKRDMSARIVARGAQPHGKRVPRRFNPNPSFFPFPRGRHGWSTRDVGVPHWWGQDRMPRSGSSF